MPPPRGRLSPAAQRRAEGRLRSKARKGKTQLSSADGTVVHAEPPRAAGRCESPPTNELSGRMKPVQQAKSSPISTYEQRTAGSRFPEISVGRNSKTKREHLKVTKPARDLPANARGRRGLGRRARAPAPTGLAPARPQCDAGSYR